MYEREVQREIDTTFEVEDLGIGLRGFYLDALISRERSALALAPDVGTNTNRNRF
jgi:hypothetical protein